MEKGNKITDNWRNARKKERRERRIWNDWQ